MASNFETSRIQLDLSARAPWLGAIAISNVETIDRIAAFGVVALLFTMGLELSLERIRLMRRLVFGLGLNVNSPASAWPSDLARRAVSLSELAGGHVDLNRLTAALVGRVVLAYERFIDGDHRDEFVQLWSKYDVLKGREITLTEAGHKRRGTVLGIDDVGALLLRDAEGKTRGYRAGEVTIGKDA